MSRSEIDRIDYKSGHADDACELSSRQCEIATIIAANKHSRIAIPREARVLAYLSLFLYLFLHRFAIRPICRPRFNSRLNIATLFDFARVS